MDQLRQLPPITLTVLSLTTLVTLPILLQITSAYPIVFIPSRVFSKWELWRIVTAFAFAGKGLPMVFDVFLLGRNLKDLEERHWGNRTAEGVWGLMFICAGIIASNIPLGSVIFFHQFLMALTHLWAQANPTAQVSLFGLLTLPAPYFPPALLLIDLIKGGPSYALQSLTGLLSAHLYWFLTEIYPAQNGGRGLGFMQVPDWLVRAVGNGVGGGGGNVARGATTGGGGGGGNRLGGPGGIRGWFSGVTGLGAGGGRRLGTGIPTSPGPVRAAAAAATTTRTTTRQVPVASAGSGRVGTTARATTTGEGATTYRWGSGQRLGTEE